MEYIQRHINSTELFAVSSRQPKKLRHFLKTYCLEFALLVASLNKLTSCKALRTFLKLYMLRTFPDLREVVPVVGPASLQI